MTMNSDTPALEIRAKDRDKNSAAFRECILTLMTPHRRILDIRYGLGGWARQWFKLFTSERYLGFEADHETWRLAHKPGGVEVRNERFDPKTTAPIGKIDLVLADFNNLTSLKAKPLLEVLEFAQPRAVIFTDVACSKLHLNFSSYGLKKPDLNGYVRQFSKFVLPDWTCVHTSRHHHHAVTMLFRRN